jgi:hypothetical protein
MNIYAFDARTDSEPFAILRAGTFRKGGRTIEVTESDLDAAVRNFREEVPIDFDHSFAEGRGSRAAGWITELVRRGRELFARARWTERAAEMIRSDEYRHVSAEFDPGARDERGRELGFKVMAAGLTNRPFLPDLAVALSQGPGVGADPEGLPRRGRGADRERRLPPRGPAPSRSAPSA